MTGALPEVSIAKWKGGARGAVSLYYDDGTDSAFNIARPTLLQWGVPGTFYLCAGWFEGEKAEKLDRWRCARDFPEISLGDHTYTHCGAKSVENLLEEIDHNGPVLRSLAGLPADARLSFAIPGAVPWNLSREETSKALESRHEALRHDFGRNICGDGSCKLPVGSFEAAVQILDKAEREESWQAILFHGVGGDWLRFPAEDHERLVREASRRSQSAHLWVGAESDVALYKSARDDANVSPLDRAAACGGENDPQCHFRVVFSSKSDLRTIPLTIEISTPPGWHSVRVARDGFDPLILPVTARKAFFEIVSGPGCDFSDFALSRNE